MDLSHHTREYLVSELRSASSKMGEHSSGIDVEQFVYWFSAAYAACQRVMNIECEPELFLVHLVLKDAHSQIMGRSRADREGRESAVFLTPTILEKVTGLVTDLADRIEADESYSDILESLVVASYATTGNGFYLYQTGKLKI